MCDGRFTCLPAAPYGISTTSWDSNSHPARPTTTRPHASGVRFAGGCGTQGRRLPMGITQALSVPALLGADPWPRRREQRSVNTGRQIVTYRGSLVSASSYCIGNRYITFSDRYTSSALVTGWGASQLWHRARVRPELCVVCQSPRQFSFLSRDLELLHNLRRADLPWTGHG
jgi:hypothetical protein